MASGHKKLIKLLADPELFAPVNKMPVADAKKLVQYYKDQYKKPSRMVTLNLKYFCERNGLGRRSRYS